MKAIQFGDSFFPIIDGVCTTIQNYAYWITKEHGECPVVAPYVPEENDSGFIYPIYRFASVNSIVRRPYRIGVPTLDLQFNMAMEQLAPDIVHAHSPFTAGDEALRMARRLNVPLVATFHSKFYDDFLECTKSSTIANFAVRYAVKFFEKADSVWAVNSPTADTLREYGYQGDIEIMPNGCDFTEPENPEPVINMINEKFGLAAEEKIFLFVGQQIWQKNLRTLLDAFVLLGKTNSERIIIVGEGTNFREIKAYAKTAGLENTVIFTDKIQDREILSGLYLRAHAFVFPSLYDNAPLVIREAAAMGCPSILIKDSNASENFTDGNEVFLCEDNAESLCAKIKETLNNPALYSKVSESCRQIAVPWREIVGRVVRRYEELIIDN
jgi:glycosyltransferase involved in cell wall biosynthesis